MDAKQAKLIRAKLLKIAQDELDVTKQLPSVEGQAGPQEVVDAVAEIASDIQEVLTMIPAEPSAEEGVDIDDQENIAPAAQEPEIPSPEGPTEPEKDPEKELMEAKLAKFEKQLDETTKDGIANKIAELYGNSEEKYNEIMSSDKNSAFFAAQLETLEDFVKVAKVQMKPKIAQNMSSYIKVAQQLDKNGDSKRKML